MNPEQTAPIGAVCFGSTLFAVEASKHFSRREKQTTFVASGALRVNELLFLSLHASVVENFITFIKVTVYRLRAKKGPAPPPPREFCRHILS